jgi:murein DD-endopeptidase MepM/ murein hydrolase activator NlpD
VDRGDHKHGWIDYWVNKWTSIYSMVEWTVDRVLYEDWWFGNYVVIKDKEWREIIYAHLKEKPDLQSGQQIAMWEEIWKVWSTWRSTWPHLHLEVREDWKSIDPKTIFSDDVLLV